MSTCSHQSKSGEKSTISEFFRAKIASNNRCENRFTYIIIGFMVNESLSSTTFDSARDLWRFSIDIFNERKKNRSIRFRLRTEKFSAFSYQNRIDCDRSKFEDFEAARQYYTTYLGLHQNSTQKKKPN